MSLKSLLGVNRRGRPRRPMLAKWVNIIKFDPCAYCGGCASDWTLDHITPRVVGGSSKWDNITISCAMCNRRKGSTPLLHFLLERRLYDAERAKGEVYCRLGRRPAFASQRVKNRYPLWKGGAKPWGGPDRHQGQTALQHDPQGNEAQA